MPKFPRPPKRLIGAIILLLALIGFQLLTHDNPWITVPIFSGGGVSHDLWANDGAIGFDRFAIALGGSTWPSLGNNEFHARKIVYLSKGWFYGYQKAEYGIEDRSIIHPTFRSSGYTKESVWLSLRWLLWLAWLLVLYGVPKYAIQVRRWRRQSSRVHQGLCPTCAYDLRAHDPGAKCPECGSPAPTKPKPVRPMIGASTQPLSYADRPRTLRKK